ncbi:MAG: class II fructose-bisphosphate aldolase [Planctomycetes bacterium]|nr:class II fructose-bisphosphate aldolase [Planctomycetota bacterium]
MGLVNMTAMLQAARKGGYAVGAFNIVDYNSTRAAVRAAEDLKAPIIVQVSVKTVQFWGADALAGWIRQVAGPSPVPVAYHLDHCRDVDVVRQCIDAGWTSVMIDASHLPYEENLALTRQVCAMAAEAGVSVEAEMGAIVGVEDDIFVSQRDAHLADIDQAEAFCREVDLAVFAPAIGTAHGIYKGTPEIAYDRLDAIARRTGLPIALHGGTGLDDATFKRCIELGCAKINISTALKYAFIDGFVDYHLARKKYEPLKPLQAQYEAVYALVAGNIRLFGSAGKA